MKTWLAIAANHPSIKAVGATLITQIAEIGVLNIGDYLLDRAAYRIACYIVKLEKQEKEQEK